MDNTISKDFECRAPQLYEELPLRAQLAQDEQLDEFFDVMQTPQKADSTPEEFFTPMVVQMGETPRRKNHKSADLTELSLIAEEEPEQIQPAAPPDDEAQEEKPKRKILEARRRSGFASSQCYRDEVDHLARRMFEGIVLDPAPSPKSHSMVTRLDVLKHTPKLALRNREVLKRKAANGSSPPEKFICLAERMNLFENTLRNQPKRSMAKKDLFSNVKLTVPISPHLLAKNRHRSPSPTPVDQSFKPEVHPLNPKIFNAPEGLSRPAPKPPTVPQPFNIKQVVKKDFQLPSEEPFVFKANPVPPSCRSSISSLASSSVQSSSTAEATAAVRTTSLMAAVPSNEAAETGSIKAVPDIETHKGVYHTRGNGKFKVKRAPSAERERNVQKIDAHQSEVFEFKARPVPASLYNPRFSIASRRSTSSKRSSAVTVEGRVRYPAMASEANQKKHGCCSASDSYTFKARPPTVLTKSPFKVKKANIPLTEVTDFVLNTERRAREREEFDKRIEERRMGDEMARKQAEAARAVSEKEQLIRLRKSLVPKAQPLPSYIFRHQAQAAKKK